MLFLFCELKGVSNPKTLPSKKAKSASCRRRAKVPPEPVVLEHPRSRVVPGCAGDRDHSRVQIRLKFADVNAVFVEARKHGQIAGCAGNGDAFPRPVASLLRLTIRKSVEQEQTRTQRSINGSYVPRGSLTLPGVTPALVVKSVMLCVFSTVPEGS